jgi:hypothetical protein
MTNSIVEILVQRTLHSNQCAVVGGTSDGDVICKRSSFLPGIGHRDTMRAFESREYDR